jgi:hypothetical protein
MHHNNYSNAQVGLIKSMTDAHLIGESSLAQSISAPIHAIPFMVG